MTNSPHQVSKVTQFLKNVVDKKRIGTILYSLDFEEYSSSGAFCILTTNTFTTSL